MGMSFIKTCGTSNPPAAQPDPHKFRILRAYNTNGYLLAEIEYETATNFEGRKIIVFKGKDTGWLKEQTAIDPHFDPDNSIVARFRPDQDGWNLAATFAIAISQARYDRQIPVNIHSKFRRDKKSGCLIWTGYVDNYGMGVARYPGGSSMAIGRLIY